MRPRLLATVLVFSAPAFAQTTWYVDGIHCTGSGSGTASDPFCRIQQAMAAATSGDVIEVLPGTYQESVLVPAIDITIRASSGPEATTLEGRRYLPALVASPGATLLIEGLRITLASPALQAQGASIRLSKCVLDDNYYYVGGALSLEDSRCVLEGCHLFDNYADVAGAVSANGGSLEMRDCVVEHNASVSDTAALNARTCRVDIQDCVFRSNGTGDGATAIYASSADILIAGTLFADSQACESTGTVVIHNSSASISECTMEGSYSCFEGGVYVDVNEKQLVTVSDSIFKANVAGAGGAMYCARGKAIVERCHFLQNQASELYNQGGAVHVEPDAQAYFDHCVFVYNAAVPDSGHPGEGGAIWGPAIATNCILFRNSAGGTGGAAAGGTTLENCIVWENGANALDVATRLEWCDVQGGWPGTGNFDADPMFWGPEHGDLHLLPGSPCIDAGDPNLTDQDGTRLDVGALPFDPTYCGAPGAYCVAKENSAGCVPAISWSGTPSVAGPDDFHVVATNVLPDAVGLLVWGTAASAVPFQAGTLCVAPPRHRSSPLNASTGDACDGVFDFHFTQALMQTHGLTVGDRLYLQFWYRDPAHTDVTGAGLTDGLEAAICLGQ